MNIVIKCGVANKNRKVKMKLYCKSCKKETDHIDQGNDIPKNKRYYCSLCRTSNSNYVLLWPGILKVYVEGQLVYEGNDWKAAQLATVPF